MKAVVLNGQIICVGSWDYQTDAEGAAQNPLPLGATEGDYETAITGSGSIVLASDYRALRAAAYPEIGDQLDALYHAGIFPAGMAAEIAAVKAMYPKP